MRAALAMGLMLGGWMVEAGTTVIHVEVEAGGQVVVGGSVVNAKGAIFWNGSKWVSNDTAAHTYFTDERTGDRLLKYTTTVVQGNQPGAVAGLAAYTVVRSLYNYEKAVTGGVYRFQGAQYQVTPADRTSGASDVLLRSRGTAAGTSGAFFDVYVRNPDASGVTAMRGDPVWFEYPGLNLEAAAQERSATANKVGELPTVGANYWLDANGGSDMGGFTVKLRTGALSPANAALGWGGAYPVEASVLYMLEGNLREIKFLPWAEGTFVPASGPAPSGVPVPGTVWLALTGMAGAGLAEWRRRRR